MSVLAGLLYCSWPLGYILNSPVARGGLASELAAPGQPYSWLFTYGDVASSLLMLLVIARILVIYKRPPKYILASLGGLVIFCVCATIAALCPVPCVAALHSCPSFAHSFIGILHAVSSVLVGFGLLIMLAALWLGNRSSKFLRIQLAVYFTIGAIAFVALFLPGKGIITQNIFITACSLVLAAYPWSMMLFAAKLPHPAGRHLA